MPPVTDVPDEADRVRDQLLDAAVRVFSRQGYAGTKLLDVVREAGLSTGAVYARFRSKNEMVRAAVVRRVGPVTSVGGAGATRVADLLTRLGEWHQTPLADGEALQLEILMAARREPEVADAVREAEQGWRAALQPIVDAAIADGTVDDDIDPEAVVHLVRAVHLGLLLQRAAGIEGPDPETWRTLLQRLVRSFGRDSTPSSERSRKEPA